MPRPIAVLAIGFAALATVALTLLFFERDRRVAELPASSATGAHEPRGTERAPRPPDALVASSATPSPEVAAPPVPAIVPIAPPGVATVRLVTGAAREPVAALRVFFEREPIAPGAPTHRAVSDFAGTIELDGLPVGRWHARAEDDFLFLHPRRDYVDVLPERERSPATMNVVRGALVQGSVTDKRGEPVAGASVRLHVEWDSLSSADSPDDTWRDPALFRLLKEDRLAAETSRDGRFVVRAVPGGAAYSIEVVHPAFAPHATTGLAVKAGETVDAPPIILGEGGRLRVRVMAKEKPIAGAAIRVGRIQGEHVPPEWPKEEAGEAPTATTGEDGVAIVPLLAAGSYAVSVLAAEWSPFTERDVTIEDERTAELTVALEPGVALTGVIVDAGGNPIAGALVEARRSVRWTSATTAADGRFRLGGLAPPAANVRAAAAGFASQRCEIELLPEDARIVLRREATVSGQVVDRDGKPVTHYRITAEPERSGDPFDVSQPTRASIQVADSDGRFYVAGLLAGAYRFHVDTAGRGLGSGESDVVTVADGAAIEGLRIEVEPVVRIVARVVDAATREPLAGASIEWTDRAPSSVDDPTEEPEWRGVRGRENVTGEDGKLDVDVPVAAAALAVRLKSHLETLIEPLPEPPAPGAAVELEIPLARGGTVTGHVRDAANAPASSVRVAIRTRPWDTRAVRTDSEGAYSISGLKPGDYVIGVMRHRDLEGFSESAPVSIVSDETVRVDFGPGNRRGTRVFGRVSSGGAPVASADVTLMPGNGDPAHLGTRTGDDGEFEFTSVAGGTWEIEAFSERTSRAETIVVDGETPLRVDLDLPSGRLMVTVTDAVTGAVVSGFSVTVKDSDQNWCSEVTGTDGRAEMSRLAAGPAIVHLRGWGTVGDLAPYARQVAPTSIPESGMATLEVRLSVGAALEGRVTGPDGKPLTHPEVTILDPDGSFIARSAGDYRMAIDGRYRVRALASGSYVAIVRAKGGPVTVVAGVRVETPGPSRADFALPRGGSLVVRVVGARGEPVGYAGIVCEALLPGGVPVRIDSPVTDPEEGTITLTVAPGDYSLTLVSSLAALGYLEADDDGEAVRATASVTAGETTVVTLTRP